MTLFLRILIAVLGVSLALSAIAGALWALSPALLTAVAGCFLFGLWSLLCVLVGYRLGAARGYDPQPIWLDPDRMFNWIRTGKAEGEPEDERPPFEKVDPESAQGHPWPGGL